MTPKEEAERYWERNMEKWTQYSELYGKKEKRRRIKPKKHSKNAKTAQSAVKTPISIDSEASDTEFRAELLEKWSVKPTDSTPNPNDAFREKKRKKMGTIEYLNYFGKTDDDIDE